MQSAGRAGRPQRPVVPGDGPEQELALALRQLREDSGSPSYRVMAGKVHYSASALARAASGAALPGRDLVLAYVRACGGDQADWDGRWAAAAAGLGGTHPGPFPSPDQRDESAPRDDCGGRPTARRASGRGPRVFGFFAVGGVVLAVSVAVAMFMAGGGRPVPRATGPGPRATGPTGSLTPGWSLPTGGAVVSTPAVADGIVYVASDDHFLYAVQAATGRILRRVSIGSENDSSPVVAGGYVYAGSWNSDLVSAFNPTLQVRHWTFRTGSSIDSTPAVAGSAVFIGSDDHNMYALSKATGIRVWATNLNGEINAQPLVAGGQVFVGTWTDDPPAGRMYALNAATGNIDWSLPASRIDSGAVAAGSTMYFGSDDGRVWAVDPATGHVRWTFRASGAVESTPAVAAGTVYVGSDDGTLYALNAATGRPRWTYATGEYITDHPVVAGNVVYFGSYDHYVYALNAGTGRRVWRHLTGGHVESSPAIADGIVYIGSDDGKLYAMNARTGD